MKAIKIPANKANLVDLGTKKIYEYPLNTRLMSVAYMVIKGRHPKKGFLFESDCSFMVYVTKGKGKLYVDKLTFNVEVGDVVFLPAGSEFACEGKFEYVTVDTPAFYPEQSKEVKE